MCASVLGWDCATHLPNGFILRENEDRLPHVAPISPLVLPPQPLQLPSPWDTFTAPGLCTRPVLAFAIASHMICLSSASSLSPYETRRGAPLTSTPQKPGPGPQNLVTRIYSVHCALDTQLVRSTPCCSGKGYVYVIPCSTHSSLLDQPARVTLALTGHRGTSVRGLKEPPASWAVGWGRQRAVTRLAEVRDRKVKSLVSHS